MRPRQQSLVNKISREMRKGKKKQGNWGRQKMVKRGLGRRPTTSASVHKLLSTQVVQLETKGIAISQTIIWVRLPPAGILA